MTIIYGQTYSVSDFLFPKYLGTYNTSICFSFFYPLCKLGKIWILMKSYYVHNPLNKYICY